MAAMEDYNKPDAGDFQWNLGPRRGWHDGTDRGLSVLKAWRSEVGHDNVRWHRLNHRLERLFYPS